MHFAEAGQTDADCRAPSISGIPERDPGKKLKSANLILVPPLIIHGLFFRPATGPDSIVIPFDSTVAIQFIPGRAETYFLWRLFVFFFFFFFFCFFSWYFK
jgi:hypothetical protein